MRNSMPSIIICRTVKLIVLMMGLFLATGCIRAYTPPTSAEPHAVLKLRRTYAQTKGVKLRERFLIQSKYSLLSQTVDSRNAENPLIDGILIHPEPAGIEATSVFFHFETRMVRESYQEQEPYMATETYNCGAAGTYRTCTRSVTRYRSVTKYRDVMKTVEVPDLSCSDSVIFQPADGHIYLLEMTVQDQDSCNLICYEQIPNPDGTFANAPCQMLTVLPED